MEINKISVNWTGLLDMMSLIAQAMGSSLSNPIHCSGIVLKPTTPFMDRPHHPPSALLSLMVEYVSYNADALKRGIPSIIGLISSSRSLDLNTISDLASIMSFGKPDNKCLNLLSKIDSIQAEISHHWVDRSIDYLSDGSNLPENYHWPQWLDQIAVPSGAMDMFKSIITIVKTLITSVSSINKEAALKGLSLLDMINVLIRSGNEMSLNAKGKEKVLDFLSNILVPKMNYDYIIESEQTASNADIAQ